MKASPGIRHQVGAELNEVGVEASLEPQGSGDGGHDLPHQTVDVGVGGSLDVQVAATDVPARLVVHEEGAVRVFQGGVGVQDGVVGLHDDGRNLYPRQ